MLSSSNPFGFAEHEETALVAVYKSYGLTPERIACSDEHRGYFEREYRQRSDDFEHPLETILLNLFHIRKCGGLPRLGRG